MSEIEYIELLSEEVHKAWMQEKISQGFHSPMDCPGYQWLSLPERKEYTKYDKHCLKCHTDIYTYSELPENIKEYNRATVRAVISAQKKIEDRK